MQDALASFHPRIHVRRVEQHAMTDLRPRRAGDVATTASVAHHPVQRAQRDTDAVGCFCLGEWLMHSLAPSVGGAVASSAIWPDLLPTLARAGPSVKLPTTTSCDQRVGPVSTPQDAVHGGASIVTRLLTVSSLSSVPCAQLRHHIVRSQSGVSFEQHASVTMSGQNLHFGHRPPIE